MYVAKAEGSKAMMLTSGNGAHRTFFGAGLPDVDLAALKGKLIVVEGPDSSGRSTQIQIMRDWLERNGYPSAQTGLKRSKLVGQKLQDVMRGYSLGPLTFSLYYATDLADQIENVIIPALRADFVVLADRYIYTPIARDVVRGVEIEWIMGIFGFAIVPDVVVYLDVEPEVLAERVLGSTHYLDYWESGMDIHRNPDMYGSFVSYQKLIREQFAAMASDSGFHMIDGDRPVGDVADAIKETIKPIVEMS